MIDFLVNNYIEILAATLGLLFLYLEIKENKWMWLVGFLTSALYIYVFFVAKLYATMSLQFYYVAISIYGWIMWAGTNNNEKENTLKISHIAKDLLIKLLLVTIVVYALIAYILVDYTDEPTPYLDALATALSIVASWMLAQKILEQWLVWIVADAISLGLYIHKGLYPSSILFLTYTVIAILGYYKWKQSMIGERVEN